jgi:hypothetical protein
MLASICALSNITAVAENSAAITLTKQVHSGAATSQHLEEQSLQRNNDHAQLWWQTMVATLVAQLWWQQ